MHNHPRSLRIVLPALAFAVLGSACTAGVVREGSVRLASARVDIIADGFSATTATDAQGYFGFNPYSPSSSAFDWSKYVPEGQIVVSVTTADQRRFVRVVDHHFTQRCDLDWNGQVASRQCALYDFNFEKPQALSEEDSLRLQAYLDRRRGLDETIANLLRQLQATGATVIANIK